MNKWLGPQAVRVGVQQGDGEVHGFWNSRRGGIQQVPDPEAERVQRLEQELRDLREALTMRRLPGQEPLGAYGSQPFQRVGPPSADPPGAQWHLRQACNDVNMRDWIQVNSENPYRLETNLDIKEASLGILVKVEVNIKEVELVTQEVPWVVEFKMIGLVRKSSSR